MNVLLRSVVADLWRGSARWRSLLVVVTTALGVAAFTALLASAGVLTREIHAGYRATDPADITLVLAPADAAAVVAASTSAERVAGVAAVEARGTWRGRVRTGPLQWRPLQLIAPASFDRVLVSRFFPQDGSWPPATDEVLVERDALQVAHARIGDSIVARDPNGIERSLRIAGTAYDPGQAQARMEDMVYGYATPQTLERLGEASALDRLLVRLDGPAARADARSIADLAAAAVEAVGVRVVRTDFARGHPHAPLMRTLFHLEGVFGLLALLFTGFLCGQLFTAQMATQVRRIGVLKAIGARLAQVRRVYLLQAALLGVAACGLGLPLGLLGGDALSRYLAVYLNFDLQSLAVEPWLYALAGVASVAVPVAAAWLPVRRGSRMSVAAGVVQHGVGARAFAPGALDRLVTRVSGGWLPAPAALAVRSTFRRRARSLFAVMAIAFGGFCFLAAADARATLFGGLDRFFGSRGYDLTLDLTSLQQFADVERAAAGVDGIAALEGSITTRGTLTRPVREPGNGKADRGVSAHLAAMLRRHGGDPTAFAAAPQAPTFSLEAVGAASTMHRADLVAGRMLAAGDGDGIVVNEALALLAGDLRIGDRLAFAAGGQALSFCVLGVVREPFAQPGAYALRDEGVFANHPGLVNTLRLRFASPDLTARDRARTALEQAFAAAKVAVAGSRTTKETRYVFDQHFAMVYDVLVGIAALVLLVGAIALVSLLGLDAIERRPEFAVLRALGASSRAIAGLLLGQGCLLSASGFGLAMLGGWSLEALGGIASLFPTRLEPMTDGAAPWTWLAVAAIAGLLASALPAWRASRTTIREALSRS